jgi:hypothetical protein
MYAYKLLLYIDHSDQELPWGLDKSTGWTVFYEGLKTIPLHSVCLLHMYYMCLHSIRIQIVGPILWHTCPQRHIKWQLLPALHFVFRSTVVAASGCTYPGRHWRGRRVVAALLHEVCCLLWYVERTKGIRMLIHTYINTHVEVYPPSYFTFICRWTLLYG